MIKSILVAVVLSITVSCGHLSTQQSTQTVTAAESRIDTSQDVVQSSGAVVETGVVESIITQNTTGITPWIFLAGVVIGGILIRQPKFIRAIW